MPLINVLSDVKPWIGLGIIAGLLIGFDNPDAATILMVVLIAQMTVSLDGISFAKSDFKTYDRQILMCVICCFLINTGFTLLTGLFFIDNTQLWYGWVMLSSVPCAVSVVVSSLVMKGDAKMSVLGLTVTYVFAIALTPLITHAILGNAVDPLEILRYILMFIAIPFILTIPLKRVHLKRTPKSLFINLMMFFMVFIGLGSRRDFILGEPDVIAIVLLACVARVFAVSIVFLYAFRMMHVARKDAIVYFVNIAWKNSGMSISLTLALFGILYPNAVLPCIASLVVESIWFAIMSGLIEKMWPNDEPEAVPA